MPDEKPIAPKPASGAERLSLSVESVREPAARPAYANGLSPRLQLAPPCFADDGAEPQGTLSPSQVGQEYTGLPFADDEGAGPPWNAAGLNPFCFAEGDPE